jgi:glycosyltransferase involved in cell wall biosynthesis
MANAVISSRSNTVREVSRDRCKLSIIIIGRNEEQFIERGIESSLNVRGKIHDTEIIFVDSASTDQSVPLAKKFPITILQLKPDWPLCVAAGRYTGYRWSSGDYVFFLDGDAEVNATWLADAVKFLDENGEYAGVAGVLDEEYITSAGLRTGGAANVFNQDLSRAVIDSKVLGGIALFRRSVLEEVGTVNPHLPTAEDHELCLRIRRAGWKVARIKGKMALKYTEDRQTLYEVLRRARTRMYNYGAVLKYCQQYGAGWQYCIDTIPYLLSFALFLLCLVVALPIAVLTDKVQWYVGFVAATFLAIAIKKRSIKGAVLSIAVRSVSLFKTLLSYLRTNPKSPLDYPTDVIHVQ